MIEKKIVFITNCIKMGFKRFFIKKGENSSGTFWSPFLKIKSISYRVIFNQTCIYKCYSGKEAIQNNLFGFKLGFKSKNSAEFTWACNQEENKIKIAATCYRDGVRYVKELCELKINRFYILEIKNLEDCYEFSVSNINGIMTFARLKKPEAISWGRRTFPNFRTFLLSLQDIEISMRRLS